MTSRLAPSAIARCALTAFVLLAATRSARAQSRTSWEMNAGEGIVDFFPPAARHGDESEYQHAMVPSPVDPNWGPAPDGVHVNYHVHSTLCSTGAMCSAAGDFTYFRTTLCVPNPHDIASISVTIGAVDDGARVSVINSAFPGGVTPSNGYAYLGGGAITSGDFASDLRAGEPNTILITHVDDCCEDSQLTNVVIHVNGRELVPGDVGLEQCNGLDDNCNGATDEGFGDLHCGRGACAVTVPACDHGVGRLCRPLAPNPEVCDGIDNDCNGITDDPAGGCNDGGTEPSPDAATDVSDANAPEESSVNDAGDASDVRDAGMDGAVSCGDPTCDRSLRLEGRAGPIGSCLCTAPGGRTRSGAHGGTAVVSALAIAFACSRRSPGQRSARR